VGGGRQRKSERCEAGVEVAEKAMPPRVIVESAHDLAGIVDSSGHGGERRPGYPGYVDRRETAVRCTQEATRSFAIEETAHDLVRVVDPVGGGRKRPGRVDLGEGIGKARVADQAGFATP